MTNSRKIIVGANEFIRERFVTRKWLGLLSYKVVVLSESMGYNVYLEAPDETPRHIFLNGEPLIRA